MSRREPTQLTLLGPPCPPPAAPPEPDADDADDAGEPSAHERAAGRVPALRRGDIVAGRYRVEGRIGCGGMASVFLAHHVEIGAAVAIKVLEPELAAMRGAADRFLFEAKASSWVHHPNVVAISDFGQLDNGLPYIVMEYLVGEDLDVVIRRTGAMPWPRVRAIALQICSALQAAHDAGVIHRDVKLQNCFRQSGSGGQDFIKVLDFGIAKVTEELLADRHVIASTTEGIVVGTPDYMAPEQGRRGKIDHRADIYSLGVVLYHLVTGRLPFAAKHPIEQMAQHLYEEPPPPREIRPDVDPRVEALILRALSKSPDDRFSSMRAFADAIERADGGSSALMALGGSEPLPRARRIRAWAMLGGAGLLALWAIVWATRDDGVVAVPTGAIPVDADAALAVGADVEDRDDTLAPVASSRIDPAPSDDLPPTLADLEPPILAAEAELGVEVDGAMPLIGPLPPPAAPAQDAAVPDDAEDSSPARTRTRQRRARHRGPASRRSPAAPRPEAVGSPRPSASDDAADPVPPAEREPPAKPTPKRAATSAPEPFRAVDVLKNPYD